MYIEGIVHLAKFIDLSLLISCCLRLTQAIPFWYSNGAACHVICGPRTLIG